jgi:hypothetical protein
VPAIGYAGAFAGPPLIGALAELLTLPAALGLLVVGALAIALRAPHALAHHPRRGTHDHAAQPSRARAQPSRARAQPSRGRGQGDIAPASPQYYDPNQRTTSP